MQVEKEVGKARGLMGEVEAELARKKAASRRVKALRAEIGAAEAEAAALGAQQQHLERQRASLVERLQRLEHQARFAILLQAVKLEQCRDVPAAAAPGASVLMLFAEAHMLLPCPVRVWTTGCVMHV